MGLPPRMCPQRRRPPPGPCRRPGAWRCDRHGPWSCSPWRSSARSEGHTARPTTGSRRRLDSRPPRAPGHRTTGLRCGPSEPWSSALRQPRSPLLGSYDSAAARAFPSRRSLTRPPVTRTLPSSNRVAVWNARGEIILPVACQAGARVVFGVGGADGAVGDAVTRQVGTRDHTRGRRWGLERAKRRSLASRLGLTDDDVAAQALTANRRPAPASMPVARRNQVRCRTRGRARADPQTDLAESRLRGQCRLDFMVG